MVSKKAWWILGIILLILAAVFSNQLAKGIRSEQKIPTSKIDGFRKFDKVRYKNKYYFIKGRMSKGYAILMDLFFNQVKLKPIPKFNLMTRIESRKIWMKSSIKARHSSATLKK